MAGVNLVPLVVIGTLIWSRRELNLVGRAAQASPGDHTVNDLRIRIEDEYRDRVVIRGGVLMFGADDALGMVERARELGVAILGIDVFHLTPSTTQPDLGMDLNLSSPDVIERSHGTWPPSSCDHTVGRIWTSKWSSIAAAAVCHRLASETSVRRPSPIPDPRCP